MKKLQEIIKEEINRCNMELEELAEDFVLSSGGTKMFPVGNNAKRIKLLYKIDTLEWVLKQGEKNGFKN